MSFVVIIWICVVCVMLTSMSNNILQTNLILCPSWQGRLGNIMFQYASLYGIAQQNKRTLVVEETANILDIFQNIYAVRIQNDSVCQNVTRWYEYAPCGFSEYSMNISSKEKYIKHKSFLQSWKYFNHVESEIRQQFKFDETTDTNCQQRVDGAVNEWRNLNNKTERMNVEIIGIHVRREDYLTTSGIKFGYQVADEDYMNRSMNYFRDRYQDVVFLVYTTPTSADLLWCENHVIGNDVVQMPMDTPDFDMCSLSKCNHSIITVGSFGWWSAWLANGTTVYFKDVARNNSRLRDDFSADTSDYFYPGWIGM